MTKGYSMEETSRVADEAALEVSSWLQSLSETVSVKNVENDREYQKKDIDLLWTFKKDEKIVTRTVEIKADRYYNTGNYFFETVSNAGKGTPGCFMYSEADFLFYYFIEVRELHIIALSLVRRWFKEEIERFQERKLFTKVGNGATYGSVGRLVPRRTLAEELPKAVKVVELWKRS